MIKRELYMRRIRPFIDTDLIKVMTGIRRCGKSVMLELIKQELEESGINPQQFISINFEDLNFAHLQTAKALRDAITKKASEIGGKVYLFLTRFSKCGTGKNVSTLCVFLLTVIFVSRVQMPGCCPVNLRPILEDVT